MKNSLKKVEKKYNPEDTWEYNLIRNIRWNSEDKIDDMCFYIKKWLKQIAEEEGYIIKKEN
jgi:hypothetical protein